MHVHVGIQSCVRGEQRVGGSLTSSASSGRLPPGRGGSAATMISFGPPTSAPTNLVSVTLNPVSGCDLMPMCLMKKRTAPLRAIGRTPSVLARAQHGLRKAYLGMGGA